MEVQPGFGQDGQEAFGDMVAASLLISALNKPESEQAVGPKLRRLVFPAFDRNQLTEDFLETVKACEESRESRGRPYVDIILGASLASGV
ncbi:hypothetical protein BD410DRAFT_793592 [Rickenella mellea]|uniref:Uncharacterized protein n=1 Tax=Rickenella mellea TaxID=50990 RepID=A0A4Y7PSF2_9AGAM|nr:hypothetical protein BD410DRAFT_793592 [Rickenella mellea]